MKEIRIIIKKAIQSTIHIRMAGKRPIEEVDDQVRSLVAEQDEVNRNQTRKRQRNFAPMTQFTPRNDDNSPPPGYIKKVILKNFMCHEHFELELGPRLNFIVGNNGSGKSAVLTAITIGLGAKATDTNRGSSLKDLIKEGRYSSKILIILDNRGYGGYEQGVYGDEIRIERTIKRDGPASFSIRSEADKEVSNKKRDLQSIVDYFAVPVMNPMCFLSQDAARSFLTASTPHDKYKHFMRGTLLDDTENNLNNAVDIAANAQSNLELHAQNVKMLRQDYEEAKRLLKEISASSDLNHRKRVLQGKTLWLNVKENEENHEMLKQNVENCDSKISMINNKITTKRGQIERYTNDQDAMNQELQKKYEELQQKKAANEEAKAHMMNFKLEHQHQKDNQHDLEKNIAAAQKKIAMLEKLILVEETKLNESIGGDKEQMRVAHQEMQQKIRQLENNITSVNMKYNDLRDKERVLANDRRVAVDTQERGIHEKINELREMSRGKDNLILAFDRNMERVLRAIESKKNSFSTPPIGPLGMHVTIREGFEKWARPIQRVISGTLNSFVVANSQDNKLLKQIFISCGIKSNFNVITYKLTNFNYNHGKAKTEHPCIVDALEFSSRELECLFVDQSRIEKILLIEDKNEARDALKKRSRNVIMALSLKNARSGFQSSLSSYDGFRIDTIDYQDKMKMKTKSSDDGTKYLKDLINEERHELERTKVHYDQLFNELRTEMRLLKADIDQSRSESQRLTKASNHLSLKIDKEVDTGKLEQSKVEKKNQEHAVISYQGALQEIEAKLEKIGQDAQPYKNKFDLTKVEQTTAEQELVELKNTISTRDSRVQKLEDDIEYYSEKKKDLEQKRESILSQMEEFEQGIQSQIRNAEVYCSRDQAFSSGIPETYEEVKREIERITNQIRNAENRVGMTQEDITKLFEDTKAKHKEAEKKYEEIDKAISMLNESLKSRWTALGYAKQDTCITADTDFKQSLRFRNFSGGLHFDFGKGTLSMLVKTTNDEQARNVDTLSGGEKSFSQISLLLATWRPMRSRIIALDEFDVFMDQVNRTIGTKLIMSKLSVETRTQTIIITPQDIGKIANFNDPGIRIHKMRDPQRQSNSNFYSQ